MGDKKEEETKDKWDKWEIILSPVGGLLTALAVGFLTLYSSWSVGKWQKAENEAREKSQQVEVNTRLFTELMSKREEAETSLRKEMFGSILNAFLKSSPDTAKSSPDTAKSSPDTEELNGDVLKLELLAYNFHESLNLSPLFKHLQRRIEKWPDPRNEEYLSRLQKVADDVIAKQLSNLQNSSNSLTLSITFTNGLDQGSYNGTKTDQVVVEGIQRVITLTVLTNDVTTHQLHVSLDVKTLTTNSRVSQETLRDFWVGTFDFPMIDNTRLSSDQRCAVVLTAYQKLPDTNVQLTVVCFPGSRAALKEKPYYDEVLDKLQPKDKK